MIWAYLAAVMLASGLAIWAVWLFLCWLDEKFEEWGD